MKNNKDHEYIRDLFDGSEVKAPESLSEENVRAMLENEEQSSEERTVISSLRAGKRRRRNFGVFAACVVLAVCLIPAGKWAVSPHPGKTVEAGEGMLKFATVIEDHSKEDEVGLNKCVECLFLDDNETETYKIVTPIRGDTMENRISIESPLGKTLLRHHVGDVVHVDTELGGYDLKILSITPDDTDDEIRSF